MVVLGCGPFLPGLGDGAEVAEDRAVDYAVAVGFGHVLQECQGVAESGLGGLDVAAEVFCGAHDAVTAGAQAGVGGAGQVESRTPVTLRFAEVAEVKRDVGQADQHVDPFGGIADERHLGFGQGAVEIPAHECELGAEQPDAGVFYRQEPGQLLGFGPVA